MQIEKADGYRESVIQLLEAEKLPVTDLPERLDNFLVARHDNEVVGKVWFGNLWYLGYSVH